MITNQPSPTADLWECELSHGGRVLQLNGKLYAVEKFPDGVRLVTETGEPYEVRRGSCTCQSHAYGKRGYVCKHRMGVLFLELLEQGAANAGS